MHATHVSFTHRREDDCRMGPWRNTKERSTADEAGKAALLVSNVTARTTQAVPRACIRSLRREDKKPAPNAKRSAT